MARKSPRSISIDPNIRCLRIYPTEDNGMKLILQHIGLKKGNQMVPIT